MDATYALVGSRLYWSKLKETDMTKNIRPRARRGFTMIELLVVIAIIAIMAGMMLPVLSKAREAGRRVVCMSNLRQVGMGLQMYASDHGERLPALGPSGREWPLDIMSYIGSSQIFTCPTDNHSGEPTIGGYGA